MHTDIGMRLQSWSKSLREMAREIKSMKQVVPLARPTAPRSTHSSIGAQRRSTSAERSRAGEGGMRRSARPSAVQPSPPLTVRSFLARLYEPSIVIVVKHRCACVPVRACVRAFVARWEAMLSAVFHKLTGRPPQQA